MTALGVQLRSQARRRTRQGLGLSPHSLPVTGCKIRLLQNLSASTAVQRKCILVHLGLSIAGPAVARNPAAKLLLRFHLCPGLAPVGESSVFGLANALFLCNKEAATYKAMSFTLFNCAHFTMCRSGWRNGPSHRLS